MQARRHRLSSLHWFNSRSLPGESERVREKPSEAEDHSRQTGPSDSQTNAAGLFLAAKAPAGRASLLDTWRLVSKPALTPLSVLQPRPSQASECCLLSCHCACCAVTLIQPQAPTLISRQRLLAGTSAFLISPTPPTRLSNTRGSMGLMGLAGTTSAQIATNIPRDSRPAIEGL